MKYSQTTINVLTQIGIMISLLLILPMMVFVFTGDVGEATRAMIGVMPALIISSFIFMINYWWLVPRFYYRGKRYIFYPVNLLLYILLFFQAYISYSRSVGNPSDNIFIFASTCFIILMLVTGSAAMALALRNALRNKILREQFQEEKRRHVEDELTWLKNQINPHFLFNTLNNISALINLDPGRAQESISRLSDLLRYAMYETSKPFVPLNREVDFIKDYISLMKLRCNNKTIIKTNFEVESNSLQIPPLLLISLVENAFKHGVSSNQLSEITILMEEKEGILKFECVNSNHAKDSSDNSGSGIGLANMKRRLELLYPEKHEWEKAEDEDQFRIALNIAL